MEIKRGMTIGCYLDYALTLRFLNEMARRDFQSVSAYLRALIIEGLERGGRK